MKKLVVVAVIMEDAWWIQQLAWSDGRLATLKKALVLTSLLLLIQGDEQ